MDKLEVIDKNSEKMLDASKEIRSFINSIIDENSFVETNAYMAGPTYIDGTEALGEGVVTGFAYVTGTPVCVIAQNYDVLKGSCSVTHLKKIEKALIDAHDKDLAVISIISSNGARLGEGVAVLDGYSSIIALANELKGDVPHFAVVDGPCVGLMSSYVNACDFVFVNAKKGYVSLNAPQVVLSKAKSYAEANVALGKELAKKSMVVSKLYNTVDELSNEIYKMFNLIYGGDETADDPNRVSTKLNKDVSVANLLAAIYDDKKCVTLYDDYAKEVTTAIGFIQNVPCAIVATDGKANDGYLSRAALKKINVFCKKVDTLHMPLITLVDSKGINTTLCEEQDGISLEASELFETLNYMDSYKISVITKNAVGFSYSALCSKNTGFDKVIAFCDAYVSPLNAETAVQVLAVDDIKNAKDPVKAKENLEKAYVTDAANPYVTAKQGCIDFVIEPAVIRPYIISLLRVM